MYKVVQIRPGLNLYVNKCKQSQSYLNHLVIFFDCVKLCIFPCHIENFHEFVDGFYGVLILRRCFKKFEL